MNNLTQKQIDYMMDKQRKLLTILGVVTTVLIEIQVQGKITPEQRPGLRWIMEALESVIYQDKPLPPFPER